MRIITNLEYVIIDDYKNKMDIFIFEKALISYNCDLTDQVLLAFINQ